MANIQCAALNADTFDTITAIHPDVLLLHAMWREDTDLAALRETIFGLRRAGVRRIVIVGPVPYWKRTLPFTLVNAYRLQHRLPDRIASGVFGAGADSLMENFSNAERVEYVSAWMRFCNSDGCLTRAGPSAEDLVVWDQAHLSEKGSEYLGEAIANYLLAADTANIFNAAP
jgi:hypothetical protein